MENVTKLNLIKQGEADPAVEHDKEKIRCILLDVLEKVDTESLRTLALVAITDDGSVVQGRHVLGNYHLLLGGLGRSAYIVNQLLDGVNNASEQEY
ncbi:Uncharacterised protein [Serratia quinivorans]|uniref:hypothetical protein n=1 Tax=Serratia quinivorans TaxID=137545 RepID=UPI00217A06A1|nr:hypothetical protein [Serratia quinivorans]CAI0814275.1 Uncharacterised protein [Serratia quinivorans]CAI0923799.1 Uncharacterised protein [Serratia quinivorans]CAI1713027.1 Uncharacterised protein [Serratia quinivorans]CAI2089204.1 Uncharacterised protein [Serratia quinivorans]CAI2429867.1 Uncharacterised protein [Serratia quinivorans]